LFAICSLYSVIRQKIPIKNSTLAGKFGIIQAFGKFNGCRYVQRCGD
jgi:hypothetical protein